MKSAHAKEVEELRAQVKQMAKEKEDTKRRMAALKQEVSKYKAMHEKSELIRNNQQSLIELQ